MNSYDPWHYMLSSPPGERMIVPAPYYGHPGFLGPSGGIFIGAEAAKAKAPRGSLTAEVAPVVAPATGGITAHVELDRDQRLHAKICVDGKCYEGGADLAPAIAAVMARFAQYHTDLHAAAPHGAAPDAAVSGGAVIGAVNAAVGAAGDELVQQLLRRHRDTAISGWLSDLGNAVKSAAGSIAGGIGSTLSALKGPISAAAGIAAGAGAALIPGVGPLIAPLAAKLANDVVNATAGDKAAKKRVAKATQKAKTDPEVALALDVAKKAAAQSTVAHHVEGTAKKAAGGDPAAQQKIASVVKDAEKGDPAAHSVKDLVESGFVKEMAKRVQHSNWGAKLWERATGRGPATAKVPELFDPTKWGGGGGGEAAKVPELFDPTKWGGETEVSGWVDIVGGQPWYAIVGSVPWHNIVGSLPWYTLIGAVVDDLRARATAFAVEKREKVVGVVRSSDGLWHVVTFANLDDADDWFGDVAQDPSKYAYVAYFDKKGRLFPHPENEKVSEAHVPVVPGPAIPRGITRAA